MNNIARFQQSTVGLELTKQARSLYHPLTAPADKQQRAEEACEIFERMEQVGSADERRIASLTRQAIQTPGLSPSLVQGCLRAASCALGNMTPGSTLTMGQVLGEIVMNVQTYEELKDFPSPVEQMQQVTATYLEAVRDQGATPGERAVARVALESSAAGDVDSAYQSLYSASVQLSRWNNPTLNPEVSLAEVALGGADWNLAMREIAEQASDPQVRMEAAQLLAKENHSSERLGTAEFLYNLARQK